MDQNDKLATTANENQEQAASLNDRRRFLKGTTLALPAVMTLNSVAAQAAALTSSKCGQSQPATFAAFILSTQTQDGLFRVKRDTWGKIIKTGNGQNATFRADNTPTYFEGIRIKDQTKCWRYVADGTEVPKNEIQFINKPDAGDGTGTAAPSISSAATPVGFGFAIVHYSLDTGAQVAVGEPTTPKNSNAFVTSLSQACLHSLFGLAG